MGHSYTTILVHYVFSTKGREKLITPDLQARLYPYIGGIARTNKMTALAVGGIDDHLHALLALPSTLSIAKAVQLVKGGSSKWVHDSFPEHGGFAWQEGYGAFTVGKSQIERTVRYIGNQAEHHREVSFQEEFLGFLETHEIEYDPRYIWG